MKNNSIPISSTRTSDSKIQPTLDAETKATVIETGIVSEKTETAVELAEDTAVDASQEALAVEDSGQDEPEQVEGRIVLAVKVTRKQRSPTKRDAAAKVDYTPRYDTPARKPAAKRPVSFNPLAWVADGVTGAIEEACHNDLGLSEDFWTHLYAVRREGLLTAQALVQSLIERVESKSDELEEREQRRERRGTVDIDF